MSTLTYADRERRGATTGTLVHERRIEKAAAGHLRRSGCLALRDTSCACREEVETLWGWLPTNYYADNKLGQAFEPDGARLPGWRAWPK